MNREEQAVTDTRIDEIRKRVEKATPREKLHKIYTSNLPIVDADFFNDARTDILLLLSKLDAAERLAEIVTHHQRDAFSQKVQNALDDFRAAGKEQA